MKVTFLIGAGASVPAGVPVMTGFIDGFRQELGPSDRATVDEILGRLHSAARDGLVDLELLIDRLQRATNLENETVAALLNQTTSARLDVPRLRDIAHRLRAYVRLRCSAGITPEKVDYLLPLLDFARFEGTLDIFSLNYDMCIEMLADRSGTEYTDGFDLYWKSHEGCAHAATA